MIPSFPQHLSHRIGCTGAELDGYYLGLTLILYEWMGSWISVDDQIN
jgi:hypothetical protein